MQSTKKQHMYAPIPAQPSTAAGRPRLQRCRCRCRLASRGTIDPGMGWFPSLLSALHCTVRGLRTAAGDATLQTYCSFTSLAHLYEPLYGNLVHPISDNNKCPPRQTYRIITYAGGRGTSGLVNWFGGKEETFQL